MARNPSLGNVEMSKTTIDVADRVSNNLPGQAAGQKVIRENQNALQNLSKLEDSLWEAADNLRANSKLTSSEYCMPVLGVIFLRHATNRYDAVIRQIEADKASGKIPKGTPITRAHF